MKLHGCNLIGRQTIQGKGKAFKATSPLNRQELETSFYEANSQEVDSAMLLAEKAFPIYRKKSAEERAAFLEKIAEEILAIGDPLITRANQETGLPIDRLTGERMRTVNQLRLFAQTVRDGSWIDARIDTAQPDRKPLPRPDLRRMLISLGPVVVFGSSNFPLAFSVAGGDTASALAAGNPVIVKAHRAHPGTAELVAGAIVKAIHACNMPEGVFSMLHGAGSEMGIALVKHPTTKAVGFTGSQKAGRALFDAAAARHDPIPVFAEMSSLNPLFILPGAAKERAKQIAEGLKASITMGVGQFCTKPGIIFGLRGPDIDSFAQTLGQAIEAVPPGTMLHPGIYEAYHTGKKHVGGIVGVKSLAEARTPATFSKTEVGAAIFTTEAKNFLAHPELANEVFGPFALLIIGDTIQELEKIAQGLEGQLTATLHGTPEDLAQAQNLISILETKAGRLLFNVGSPGTELEFAL